MGFCVNPPHPAGNAAVEACPVRVLGLELSDECLARLVLGRSGTFELHDAPLEFGEERLIDLLLGANSGSASMLTEEVVNAASQFSNGNFEDDLTVVAVSVD